MITFLTNFFRLTRPLSNVKNIAIVSLAFYLSETPLSWGLFILGSVALSLVFSGIYAFNGVCDVKSDEKNVNKKHYFLSVQYFGKKNALIISGILIVFGLFLSLAVNTFFFVALMLLVITGFFYSSEHVRFKEKIGLDILFGATLTFLLRFVASWFIFKISFPPLLPIFALIFLKNGGYMLYKIHDKPFLIKSGISNSITFFSQKTILITSAIFFALSACSFAMLCLNSRYLKIWFLGALPINFLFLLLFFVPPILIQYLLIFEKIKINVRHARVVGFIFLLMLIVIVFLISK